MPAYILTATRVVKSYKRTAPPGCWPQVLPPHVPQSALQQMSSFWTPGKPLLH